MLWGLLRRAACRLSTAARSPPRPSLRAHPVRSNGAPPVLSCLSPTSPASATSWNPLLPAAVAAAAGGVAPPQPFSHGQGTLLPAAAAAAAAAAAVGGGVVTHAAREDTPPAKKPRMYSPRPRTSSPPTPPRASTSVVATRGMAAKTTDAAAAAPAKAEAANAAKACSVAQVRIWKKRYLTEDEMTLVVGKVREAVEGAVEVARGENPGAVLLVTSYPAHEGEPWMRHAVASAVEGVPGAKHAPELLHRKKDSACVQRSTMDQKQRSEMADEIFKKEAGSLVVDGAVFRSLAPGGSSAAVVLVVDDVQHTGMSEQAALQVLQTELGAVTTKFWALTATDAWKEECGEGDLADSYPPLVGALRMHIRPLRTGARPELKSGVPEDANETAAKAVRLLESRESFEGGAMDRALRRFQWGAYEAAVGLFNTGGAALLRDLCSPEAKKLTPHERFDMAVAAEGVWAVDDVQCPSLEGTPGVYFLRAKGRDGKLSLKVGESLNLARRIPQNRKPECHSSDEMRMAVGHGEVSIWVLPLDQSMVAAEDRAWGNRSAGYILAGFETVILACMGDLVDFAGNEMWGRALGGGGWGRWNAAMPGYRTAVHAAAELLEDEPAVRRLLASADTGLALAAARALHVARAVAEVAADAKAAALDPEAAPQATADQREVVTALERLYGGPKELAIALPAAAARAVAGELGGASTMQGYRTAVHAAAELLEDEPAVRRLLAPADTGLAPAAARALHVARAVAEVAADAKAAALDPEAAPQATADQREVVTALEGLYGGPEELAIALPAAAARAVAGELGGASNGASAMQGHRTAVHAAAELLEDEPAVRRLLAPADTGLALAAARALHVARAVAEVAADAKAAALDPKAAPQATADQREVVTALERLYGGPEELAIALPAAAARAVAGELGGASTGASKTVKKCLPFEEAQEWARRQGLQNQREWKQLCKSGKLPYLFPTNPSRTYKDKGWISWGHWLGTGAVPGGQPLKFLPFEEAQELASRLGVKSVREWKQLCKSGKLSDLLPADPSQKYLSDLLPADPSSKYKDKGWISWGHWLGTGAVPRGQPLSLRPAPAPAVAPVPALLAQAPAAARAALDRGIDKLTVAQLDALLAGLDKEWPTSKMCREDKLKHMLSVRGAMGKEWETRMSALSPPLKWGVAPPPPPPSATHKRKGTGKAAEEAQEGREAADPKRAKLVPAPARGGGGGGGCY